MPIYRWLVLGLAAIPMMFGMLRQVDLKSEIPKSQIGRNRLG
jgi:hypothetical protein